ncbi:MAG: transglutaminase-like domain-containing protein, partial [Planctomycetota bacterium]|nr:transglutaminase-like domain-containing protein [Planctomycetota bacterium]
GECLKLISVVAGLKLEIVSCSREYALSKDNPPDFLTKLLLTGPRPLSQSEKRGPVGYRLTPKGAADLRFPSDGAQSARKQPDGSWALSVDPRVQAAHEAIPYAGRDAAALEALKPSRYVESANPKIVAAARQALGDTTDALPAARKLEAFVRTHIEKKDLSVGYASAAEVLETRQGDCTEHAVLLAALCRASGIPAQVVSGLAHVGEWAGRKDVFAPHAWVRAFIAGRWVHLDAALGYDAGHIMLGAGNGDPEGFFAILGTLGNFTLADVQPTPAPTTREH